MCVCVSTLVDVKMLRLEKFALLLVYGRVSVCVYAYVCVTFKLNFKLGNKLNLLSILFILPHALIVLVFSILFLAFFISYC